MATLDHMINCARIMNAGFAYRFYLGKAGLATKMKLINNLTLDSFMATIAEALALAEDVGIDKEEVLDQEDFSAIYKLFKK